MPVAATTINRFQAWVDRRGLSQPFPTPWWQGRNFQLCARDQVKRTKRCIISADKGSGKTSVVESIFEDSNVHKNIPGFTVVILTNRRGLAAFTRDIEMFPEEKRGTFQIVRGDSALRRDQWRNPSAKYFLTTYSTLLADCGRRQTSIKKGTISQEIVPKWVWTSVDAWICDEFHRQFRRRKSAIFDLLLDLTKHSEWLIPMSGSTVSKGPEDLWAALHLIDRKFWSTYWGYCKTWCEISGEGAQQRVFGPKLNPETGWIDFERLQRWREAVGPYMFHVKPEELLDEMPDIFNVPMDIELPIWQKKLHDQLLAEQYTELPNGEFLFSSNRVSNLYKIRLALVCPTALNHSLDVGAGIEAIYEDAEESELKRYAIFTPFKAPIPYLKAYLESKGHVVIDLQGGLSDQTLADKFAAWRAGSLAPMCLMTTIKFAESWEAPEASYGYFLGYEYDNEDNDQARKRLRRLISPKPVEIQWVRALGTYDEEFLTNLMVKNDNKRSMFDGWGYRTG